MKIPEQAVKAAEEAVYLRHERGFLIKPLIDPVDMRAALTAAAPYMSGVKVKQLEWVNAGLIHRSNLYEIEDMGPNWSKDRYQLWYNREVLQGVFGTLDEARSAAQEDFDDNVLECIVGGVDVAAVRRQALDEVFHILHQYSDHPSEVVSFVMVEIWDAIRALYALEPSSAREQALEEAARECEKRGAVTSADAIRAIKSQPAETGGGE